MQNRLASYCLKKEGTAVILTAEVPARCWRSPRMLRGYLASMIQVTEDIAIDENEIEEKFIRASGPGGQHVNKASTAVQLRFDVAHSPSLPEVVRERLVRLAGGQMTEDGVLVIEAKQFRRQERNRQDALDRLVKLVRKAAREPKTRRKTRRTQASRERRLREKRRRSDVKRLRRPPDQAQDG
jgi:ribosome-associated protein